MQVANCETTARVMREEEARLEEVYNRWKHKKNTNTDTNTNTNTTGGHFLIGIDVFQ